MNVVRFPTPPERLFSYSALRCAVSGLSRYHPNVLKELDDIVTILGRPIDITLGSQADSVFDLVGEPCGAFHVCDEARFEGQQGSLAVDVRVDDPYVRGELFSVAWEWGWSVGWRADAPVLHLDRRDFVGLPQTSFTY